jgi:NTE family protein
MDQANEKKGAALILAGAVAKGAFGAGAVETLMEAGVAVRCIVGTSAGALNGVMMASGVRSGRPKEAAKELVQLWEDEARLHSVFDLSVPGIFGGRGIADDDKLLKLLRDHVKPASIPADKRCPIDLRIVTTPLCGVPVQLAGLPARTYEKVLAFRDADLDTAQRLEQVFAAATASAAFPGAFVPKDLPEIGPCVDGGLVNNTPIADALRDSQVERVFVVTAAPILAGRDPSLRGLSLLSHLAEILIDERFYRDVRTAEEVNQQLANLRNLVASNKLSAAQLDEVMGALDWRKRRTIEVIQIRPHEPLEGNAFLGFVSGELRRKYVEAGRAAASTALQRAKRASTFVTAPISPAQ